MTITTAKWTIEEYHRMIEAGILDDRKVELINGEIIEMSPEGVPHAGLGSAGGDYLRSLLKDRAIVREGHPITLPNDSEPEPDLAIVEPLEEVYFSEHHPYVENIFWLIEYSESSLLKDTELKRKTYAAAGIREYWVVNLKTRELIVYRDPVNGNYQSEVKLIDGDIYPLAFPTIAVSVNRILRR
jgi:Uma2 family endonuclease